MAETEAQEKTQQENNSQQEDDSREPQEEQEETEEAEEEEGEGGGEESTQPEKAGPHFDFVDSFALISINLIADLVDLLSLTVIGTVVAWAVGGFASGLTLFWLYLKGVKGIGRQAIAQVVDLVPFLDALPIRTTAIVFTIILTNHPELMERFGFLGTVGGKILNLPGKK